MDVEVAIVFRLVDVGGRNTVERCCRAVLVVVLKVFTESFKALLRAEAGQTEFLVAIARVHLPD